MTSRSACVMIMTDNGQIIQALAKESNDVLYHNGYSKCFLGLYDSHGGSIEFRPVVVDSETYQTYNDYLPSSYKLPPVRLGKTLYSDRLSLFQYVGRHLKGSYTNCLRVVQYSLFKFYFEFENQECIQQKRKRRVITDKLTSREIRKFESHKFNDSLP